MKTPWDALKVGLGKFCTDTSFHGFAELYQAKSLFWKMFWIVVCGSALGITVYQVLQTSIEYLIQDSGTLVKPAEENMILYPPLKLCFWQWLHWVDFRKVADIKIGHGAFLSSVNFFTRIYSEKYFEADKVEDNLINFMRVHNYSSMFNFHISIARRVPIESLTNISLYFSSAEVIFRDPESFLFCYVAPSEMMFKYFAEHKSQVGEDDRKLLKFSLLNENYDFNGNNISAFISYNEYNYYMMRWITHKTKYRINDTKSKKNYTSFAPPLLIYPNAFDQKNDIAIIPESDEYIVDMKASVSKWQNTPKQPCATIERSIADNESCKFVCTVKAFKQNCSCIRYHFSIYMKADAPDRVCRDEFYLLPNSGDPYLAPLHTPNKTVFSQICHLDQSNYDTYANCLRQCSKACEIWTYDMSIKVTTLPTFVRTVAEKSVTNIIIEYPRGSDIQIMVEMDSQSWETFIGNVGGLLGIWTGASIVSFIQMLYLCCCANCSDCEYNYSCISTTLKCWKKSDTVTIAPSVDSVPKNIPTVEVMQMIHPIGTVTEFHSR